jgi:hypothetical protein
MDLKTLERMTVVKLREEALKIPDLNGVRAMSKDELIRAVAGALGIDLSARRRGGGGKAATKKLICELKTEVAEAIRAQDHARVKKLRRDVKRLKAETRRLAKEKPATLPAGGEAAPPAPVSA